MTVFCVKEPHFIPVFGRFFTLCGRYVADNRCFFIKKALVLLQQSLLSQVYHRGCLALRETRTRAVGEASALPFSCSVIFFANAAALSTTIVTKPQMYQPNIKVMFNRVNRP